MIVRYKLWRRFGRIGSILALPIVIFLFVQPDIGSLSKPLRIGSFAFLILLGGSGAAVAIMERLGVLQFRYSDDDKQHLDYQAAKFVAETEKSQGIRFSDRYYENMDIKPPNKSSDQKPPN